MLVPPTGAGQDGSVVGIAGIACIAGMAGIADIEGAGQDGIVVGITGTGGKDGDARGVVEVRARTGDVEVKACTGEVEVSACAGELADLDGVGILFSIICLAGAGPSVAP